MFTLPSSREGRKKSDDVYSIVPVGLSLPNFTQLVLIFFLEVAFNFFKQMVGACPMQETGGPFRRIVFHIVIMRVQGSRVFALRPGCRSTLCGRVLLFETFSFGARRVLQLPRPSSSEPFPFLRAVAVPSAPGLAEQCGLSAPRSREVLLHHKRSHPARIRSKARFLRIPQGTCVPFILILLMKCTRTYVHCQVKTLKGPAG